MSSSAIESNKKLAREFVKALNTRDITAMGQLLHKDFVWNTAVAGDDDPNELRPMQSRLLSGKALPHAKPRLTREETIGFFRVVFASANDRSDHSPTAFNAPPNPDLDSHMKVDILSMTAEEDRVSVEAEGNGVRNRKNGKYYNNFYHYLFRMHDGRIILFKEYQDTLHLFDFMTD